MNVFRRLTSAGVLLLLFVAALLSSCASTTRPDRQNGLAGAISQSSHTHGGSSGYGQGQAIGEGSTLEHADENTMLIADQISRDMSGGGLRYRTSPGDRLALSFFQKPPSSLPDMYQLNVGDRLFVNVANQEDLSREVTVRPDGRFSFYQIGEIVAMGKTIPALEQELETKFQAVIPAAELSIFLEEGNVMVKDFLDTLTSNEMQGSSRPMRIRPDGFINFPLIGEMPMVGKSLPSLSKELENKYNEIFMGSLSVTFTMIDQINGNVSVVGEVRRPGRFRIYGPTPVAEILAMAGGTNINANKTAVLIKKTGEKHYTQYYVGLNTDARDVGSGFLDGALMTMNANDILIVPKSNIGQMNVWVYQYIQRLFLFRGFSVTASGRWD